jgi:hypothetical protein
MTEIPAGGVSSVGGKYEPIKTERTEELNVVALSTGEKEQIIISCQSFFASYEEKA